MITAAEAKKLVGEVPQKVIEELEPAIRNMAQWGQSELSIPQDNFEWPCDYLLQEADEDSDSWKAAKKALEDLGYVVEFTKADDGFPTLPPEDPRADRLG